MPEIFQKRTSRLAPLARMLGSVAVRVPGIAQLYAEPTLDPALREEIMVAVSRMNDCRYCSFVHTELAADAGVPDAELAELEGVDDGSFERKRWLAIALARASVAADFGPVDPDLERVVAAEYDDRERDAIQLAARVITAANLFGNTFDALVERTRGRPAPDSRLFDEVVISVAFLAAVPPVGLALAVIRKKAPMELLRELQR